MMKSSELRLGNLISWDGQEMQVIEIFEEQMIKIFLNSRWSGEAIIETKKLDGIPLTDERLLQMGLVEDWHILLNKEDTKLFAYKLSKHLFLTKNIIRDASGRWDGFSLNILCGVVFRTVFGVPKIQYVHQLQNIYHALTGEELNI